MDNIEDAQYWIQAYNALKRDYSIIKEKLNNSEQEVAQYSMWVNDLQSGMYVNCVYCGHRYGPEESTPVAMAEILKQHIEVCPKHPMSLLKKENEELKKKLEIAVKAAYTIESHMVNDGRAWNVDLMEQRITKQTEKIKSLFNKKER